MKKIIISFLILLFIILLVFIIFVLNRKVIIHDIKQLTFSYSGGYDMYGYVYHEIKLKDDKYIYTIKPYGEPEENKKEYELTKEDIIKIEEILNKYNVGLWEGFNKSDNRVLDGNSFSFSVKYGDDKSVYAHGYMMYPNNYRNVVREIENILNKYDSSK